MDRIILSQRQQGKTRMLIKMCHADKYSLIVCPNHRMCCMTFKMAKDLKMPIPMPITFEEFLHREFDKYNIDNFYFDELQMSLQSIAGRTHIKAVTMDTTFSRLMFLKSEKKIQEADVAVKSEHSFDVNYFQNGNNSDTRKANRMAGMTEKEAIGRLIDHFAIHKDDRPTPYLDEAKDVAIKALEEIQQYRTLGTVEELKAMKEQLN